VLPSVENHRLYTPPPSHRIRTSSHQSIASLPLPRMNLRSATYHTKREVQNGVLDNKTRLEDKGDVTTDISNDSEPYFDSLDDEFDPIRGGDYNIRDDNVDVD
jgi:hypothetical protein